MSIVPLWHDGEGPDIYALVDPRPGQRAVYIGSTVDAARRYREHVRAGRSGRNPWLGAVLAAGMMPQEQLLAAAHVSPYNAWMLELTWLEVARRAGYSFPAHSAGELYCLANLDPQLVRAAQLRHWPEGCTAG